MKVGIMGGTFNPIHNGHLKIAEAAYGQFDLDLVRFLPNGHPPHKKNQKISATVEQRTRMVQLAIADYPAFILDTYEAEREAVSYSYATMEHMKETYPKDSFFFIIGADSLLDIESWVEPKRLLSACTVLAAFRGEMDTERRMQQKIDQLNHRFGAQIYLLRSPLVPVSSSKIRAFCRQKRSVHGLVPDRVEKYMIEEGLYGSEDSQN